MVVNKLGDRLKEILPLANEVWIAVALMSRDGYTFIKSNVDNESHQNILVGLDLPTSLEALKELKSDLSEQIKCKLFKGSNTFHPKVYIIKTGDTYFAFVGSANLTNGGLFENTEICLESSDPTLCENLIEWFNSEYRKSFSLDDRNLQVYSNYCDSIKDILAETNKSRQQLVLTRIEETMLEDIDFSDRFFEKEHHLAFKTEMHRDRSANANNKRHSCYKRFYNLHNIIFRDFKKYGIAELEPHSRKENIVSHYFHADGFTSDTLAAMWLSYGKPSKEIKQYQREYSSGWEGNPDERDLQSFINHARVQIKINYNNIEIWLLFGKNNRGSLFDRQHFATRMEETGFRQWFYDSVIALPDEYFISINGIRKSPKDFSTPEDIWEFCKNDDSLNYFVIGREYSINDPKMSNDQLPQTTLEEFTRLYPLFDRMRDKQFVKL